MLPHMIHAGFKELKHSQDMYNSENIWHSIGILYY